MPIIKRTVSPLGLSIQSGIKSFISANAKSMENDATVEDGADALGHAIAYGIAKGLASTSMQAAFTAGICAPAGGPVGSLIFNALKPQATEA